MKGDVLGEAGIAHDRQGKPIDRIAVLGHQPLEGVAAIDADPHRPELVARVLGGQRIGEPLPRRLVLTQRQPGVGGQPRSGGREARFRTEIRENA